MTLDQWLWGANNYLDYDILTEERNQATLQAAYVTQQVAINQENAGEGEAGNNGGGGGSSHVPVFFLLICGSCNSDIWMLINCYTWSRLLVYHIEEDAWEHQ